jgi:ADP-ribose pyrophosphatase YjhB (NUDIX family)
MAHDCKIHLLFQLDVRYGIAMAEEHEHHHAHGHIEYRFCPRCGGGLERRIVKANEPRRLVCTACSFIFYQDPKVVASTIFTLNGGIVLLKRGVEPAIGKWVFPGGYVDRGESVAEAAIRETKEESEVEVKLGPLLNVYSYPRSPTVIVVYTAKIIGGEVGAGDESLEARTFSPSQIPWNELAFDSTRDALTDYIRLYLAE